MEGPAKVKNLIKWVTVLFGALVAEVALFMALRHSPMQHTATNQLAAAVFIVLVIALFVAEEFKGGGNPRKRCSKFWWE